MGEPFRTREVNEGEEEELDDEYKDMAKELFGETDEKRLELVEEMKRQVEMKGYQVPTRKAFLLKFIRAGEWYYIVSEWFLFFALTFPISFCHCCRKATLQWTVP